MLFDPLDPPMPATTSSRSPMLLSRSTLKRTRVSKATWRYRNAHIQAVRIILIVVSSDPKKYGGRRHGTGAGVAASR